MRKIIEMVQRKLFGLADRYVEHLLDNGYLLGKKQMEAVLRAEGEKIRDKIFRDVTYALQTARLHSETFPRFHRIHEGRDFVIVASGPSAVNYKPIQNAIHCAVNRSFQHPGIDFDYLFFQDISGARAYVDQMDAYRPGKCVKFYGFSGEGLDEVNLVVDDNHARKAGALRYRTEIRDCHAEDIHFAYDLATQPLGDSCSIVFPALQFALWTGAKRIYLVGCDCSQAGYAFGGKEQNHFGVDLAVESYIKFKDFAARYYPETEIISINPVGLKGLFKDEFQS